jgi:hypothetical protein
MVAAASRAAGARSAGALARRAFAARTIQQMAVFAEAAAFVCECLKRASIPSGVAVSHNGFEKGRSDLGSVRDDGTAPVGQRRQVNGNQVRG